MNARIIKTFFYSAAAVLMLTAFAKFYSASGTAMILSRVDPLLHIKYRTVMYGLAFLELGIAAFLIRGSSAFL